MQFSHYINDIKKLKNLNFEDDIIKELNFFQMRKKIEKFFYTFLYELAEK